MTSGGVSIKTIIVIVIMLLVGVLSVLGVGAAKTYLIGASAGADPMNLLSTPLEDGKSATITWSTDKPVQGVIEYGTTPASLLLRSLETDATTSHSVTLSSLKSNTSYYFRVKVGEEVFDNSGIPYSFKTKGASAPNAPTSTLPSPTVALVPTIASASASSGCNQTTDYDSNGVVNSVDYIKCMQGGGSSTTTDQAGECKFGVDYDGNGVINSVDRISCLQKKQQ
jgi:hypothetical protein